MATTPRTATKTTPAKKAAATVPVRKTATKIPAKSPLHEKLEARIASLTSQGLHVVPVRAYDKTQPDTAKAPAMPAGYIQKPLDETDATAIAKVQSRSVDGIGVVCNARSIHIVKGASYLLTALELEGRAMTDEFLAEWREAAEHIGAGDLLRRLDRGWSEDTAGDGRRWFFRVPADSEAAASEILRLAPRIAAVRADGTYAELLVDKHQVIIAPSGGRTHPTGGVWSSVSSSSAPVVSVADLYLLSDLLAQVDEVGGPRGESESSPLDAASGRVRQVATDYHRKATTETVVAMLCANGYQVVETDGTGATVVEPVSNPGHGRARIGGSNLPEGGCYSFSPSAAPIPANRFTSAFELRAIFDEDAKGDLESLADKMLTTGEARLNPWGLMARRRPKVFPDDTQTDHLVMRMSRALADARNPKDGSLPFVFAHVTEAGRLLSLVSVDREGGLRRWSPKDSRTLLLSVAQPARATKSGDKMVHSLDPAVVDSVLPSDTPPSGVATIRFVGTQPILLPTGAALFKSGLYREHVALIAIPLRERNFWAAYKVPTKPTAADAQRACDFIVTEVLSDFPFETTADRARALSLLLTAATRHLYGAAPGFGLDAADRGTGKSMLARLARLIGLGNGAAQSISPLRADDAETAKAIVAAVLEGVSALHIDELPRGQHITSRVLSELLTSDGAMTQRVLGSNRSIGIPPMLSTVCGNNMELGADMQRRFIPVRMVHAGAELAFERDGFRHEDLPRWVRENRPQLLAALHTMAAYGIQQAPAGLPAIGSFEGWRNVVLGAMHLVTMDGRNAAGLVMEGRREFIDSQDSEGDEWLPLMQGWKNHFGTGVRVSAGAAHETLTGTRPAIELPAELLPQPGQSSSGASRSWGRALLRRRDTAVRSDDAIFRLRCIPDAKRGNAYVLEVEMSVTTPAQGVDVGSEAEAPADVSSATSVEAAPEVQTTAPVVPIRAAVVSDDMDLEAG